MFEELKKRTFKSSLLGSVILLLAGLALIVFHATNIFYVVTGYADFTQLEPDKIRGQLVEVNLTGNVGCYLERSTVSDSGRKTVTGLYYIIWTGDDYSIDWRYMSIKVPASYEKSMDAMAEGTLSTPIYFCGKIKKLDSKEYPYFREIFEDLEWTDQDIEEGTLPYYIQAFNSKTSMNILYIVLFGTGVVLFIIGIYRIIKGANGGYLKKLHQDVSNAGYTESVIESDYASAYSIDKKGTIKLGRLMTYYSSGPDARALPNSKIVWAYQNTITHRTNGIKTGTSYNIVIYSEMDKKSITLAVPNEAAAQQILQRMNTMFPWVVVGYTDELKKLYNQDRAQFLQLRYNTCEHMAVEPGFEDMNSRP